MIPSVWENKNHELVFISVIAEFVELDVIWKHVRLHESRICGYTSDLRQVVMDA